MAGGCDRWVDLSALTDADAAKRILGEYMYVSVCRYIHIYRWVDLSALTDADAAKRILGERVDVLVDLNGQSKGGRPGILLRFPAPVRLSFLGFPASVGGAADYTGADARAAPPEYQVCMHGSVQCMRACVCGWMS